MCELVDSAFGDAGDALGGAIREAGGMLTLSWLLADPAVHESKEEVDRATAAHTRHVALQQRQQLARVPSICTRVGTRERD
jgi:hypothetical protein